VVITGAGTSGRLAVHAAALSGHPRIVGLLAGGLGAFFRAREGVEDAPADGIACLREALAGSRQFVLIGISCGLSAAWVAGQVYEALGYPDATAAVIGFNPLDDASSRPLPGLDTSFRDLLGVLEDRETLLNPIIGPEPIAGSTRMKGGSATRMILDMLLSEAPPETVLETCRALGDAVYRYADLGALIDDAGEVLLAGRGIATISRERAGLMTMLDASECPPTFGSRPEQVMPFVPARFRDLLPGFALRGFTWADLAVSDLDGYLGVRVSLAPDAGLPEFAGCRDLDAPEPVRQILARLDDDLVGRGGDLVLKWLLNALTTGAFILAGKVFGNRMIDLRISNIKLWHRARDLVVLLADCSSAQADAALMTVLERQDRPEALIGLAAGTERVVPTAVLVARGHDLVAARKQLDRKPRSRDNLV